MKVEKWIEGNFASCCGLGCFALQVAGLRLGQNLSNLEQERSDNLQPATKAQREPRTSNYLSLTQPKFVVLLINYRNGLLILSNSYHCKCAMYGFVAHIRIHFFHENINPYLDTGSANMNDICNEFY
jgi:hypothetical protein